MAVPLSDAARDAVVDLVDAVRRDVDATAREPRSAVRWVRMDGLHLTLRFLGPTSPDDAAAVADAVGRAAARVVPFQLSIVGAGAFPSPARPRTIWLGVGSGGDAVAELAAAVDDELEPVGWAREARPFRAHLTLARADGRRDGPVVARSLAARMEARTIVSDADRVIVYESVTGGGPARYVPLAERLLGGAG